MRAGIFGRPGVKPMGAVADGVRALGAEPVFQRPQVWREHEAEDFGLIVTMGLRLHSGNIARLYRERGVPVLTVDLPPIRREGLWAVWPGRINALPATAPPDRLGLVTFERRKAGESVLVCGQKADDAAHGMDTTTLIDYFGRTVSMLKAKHPGRRIIWRPHPQQPLSLSAETSDPESETLEEALAGCGALVTFNSTCGITSLAAGIPTFAAREAYYRELCAPGLPEMGGRDPAPDDEARVAFFSRLTHVCWTEEEIATGRPLEETLGRG